MAQVGLYNNLGRYNVKEFEQEKGSNNLLPDASGADANQGKSFMDHLREGVQDVNSFQIQADKMSVDVATGKSQNLHETMLSLAKAELSFNFMVQVRNKALEAYNQVMNMPV